MERLGYERRILGRRASLPAPAIVVGAGVIVLAIMTLTAHGNRATVTDFLTAALEMLLPLSAGILCALLPSQDPCLELHLTLPTSFAQTAMRRWGLVVGWTAAWAWVGATGLFVGQLWRVPTQIHMWSPLERYLGMQLVWLAPLLWLATVGLGLTLLLRSAVASIAVLGGLWIVETFATNFFTVAWLHPFFLFPTTFTPFVDFWLANRLELLATGFILLPLCWFLLHNTETLLNAQTTENAG